jgi:hypothetical protein
MHHNTHKIITNNENLVCFHGKKNTKEKTKLLGFKIYANKA